MLTVSPFQSVPKSPKELRASIVTKTLAPTATSENALAPTVGAVPRKLMLVRLVQL